MKILLSPEPEILTPDEYVCMFARGNLMRKSKKSGKNKIQVGKDVRPVAWRENDESCECSL